MRQLNAGDILDVKTGKYDANHAVENGKYTFFTCALKPFYAETYAFDDEVIILPGNGANVGEVMYYKGKLEAYQRTYVLHNIKEYPKYLYYYFKKYWIRQITKRQVGSATNYIKMDDIISFKIPLPPLPQQKKIAAILDAADTYRQKTKALITKYEELTQSLFMEMFGDPVRNPMGWELQNIRTNCDKFCDGPFGSNLKSEHYVDDGVRVIRLQNIGVGIFIDKDKAYIKEEHAQSLNKHHCLPGDILIGTMGEPNLRACILPENISLAINKADCLICRPKASIFNPIYLTCLLNNQYFVSSLSNLILGQTRGRISMGRLSTRNVVTPPINLQNQFAERIKAIEAQKSQAQASLSKAEDLFNSLLKKAFKGELSTLSEP